MDRVGLELRSVWFKGWCCYLPHHPAFQLLRTTESSSEALPSPPVSVYVFMCMYVCAGVHEARGQHWMSSLITLHLSFRNIISHFAWSSLVRLIWMVSKPCRSSSVCVPVLGLQIYSTLLDFLLGGSKFRRSCLWSKHCLSSLAAFSSYSLECAIPGQASQ